MFPSCTSIRSGIFCCTCNTSFLTITTAYSHRLFALPANVYEYNRFSQWAHYAFTFDGAEPQTYSRMISVYINGELVQSTSRDSFLMNTTHGLWLCHYPFYGPTYNRYAGYIDEFRSAARACML